LDLPDISLVFIDIWMDCIDAMQGQHFYTMKYDDSW